MHSRPFVVTSSPGDKRVFHRYEEENLYAFEPLDGLGKSEPLDYTMSEFGSSAPIEEPHENDVLMGRGGKNNQHSGNEKLREVARSHCEQYRVSTKKGKSYISRQLVQYMRELTPPARFLRRNPNTSLWEDVGDDVAREKASQVLRDAVALQQEVEAHGSSRSLQPEEIVPLPSVDTSDGSQSQYSYEPTPGLDSISSASGLQATPLTSSMNRSKRARYSFQHESNSSRSLDDQPYPLPNPMHSPIRRHSLETYNARLEQPYNPHASAPGLMGDVHENFNEFDLFNGELLSSDTEERQSGRPPESYSSEF